MTSELFGLTGRPFQLTPDPRFYFDSATHRKAMAYLGYGLAQGEGFIVVTGEIGSGKTTLTGHLMATVDPARVHALRIVTTQVDGDDMLRLVAQQMGLAVDGLGKAQLIDRIEGFFIDRARTGAKTLIIVDEAQNLSHQALEELRMLSNFQAGEHAMVQIFLLGQPEFRTRLDAAPELEQLRQRVIATHHLSALDASEVGPYVLHRLGIVGWTGVPGFDESAFAALYRYSQGIPRRLNNIMSRVLLMASLDQTMKIDAALVDAVIADLKRDFEMSSGKPAPTVSPAAAPVVARVPDGHMLDQAARVAMLEAQVEEQGAALRRVLTLMIDWAEGAAPEPPVAFFRAPLA